MMISIPTSRTACSLLPLRCVVGKSVALLFAASWCPSCVQYSPSILAFYEAVNSKEPGKRPIEIGTPIVSPSPQPYVYSR